MQLFLKIFENLHSFVTFLLGTSTIHVEFNHSKDCDAAASIKRKLNGANVKLTQVSKAQMIDGINSLRR